MIIDRLYNEVEKKGPICLGLDTHLDYIPNHIKERYPKLEDVIFNFNKEIIDNTIDLVAVYKVQIAYYESYGIKGMKAYSKTLSYLREKGAISIGDIKRGDISATADMYAKAHFFGDFETDFITVNPYMGFDTVEQFLPYLKSDKGIFVLVKTSNPGSRDIEYLKANGERIYDIVAKKLEEMGRDLLGNSGYSNIGAVVAGDNIEELRKNYPHTFFLIPGYGAQGQAIEDVLKGTVDGNGGVINSSRGIIKYHMEFKDGEENFAKYARKAVLKMKEEIDNELQKG